MILSVCLSVRYRNHFPVVQFQNQSYFWNPHDPAEVFITMGRHRHPLKETPMAPESWGAPIFLYSFTAAEDAADDAAEVTASPEVEFILFILYSYMYAPDQFFTESC